MNAATPLTREMLGGDTSLWRLILRICPRRLSALLIGPESVERPVIFYSEELTDGSAKALENAVYDNKVLLDDFASVRVIFATPELFLAPAGTEDLHERMAEAMLPDYDAPRRIFAESFGTGSVVWAIRADLAGFVSRSFPDASLHHCLAVNVLHLGQRNRAEGSAAAIYALCEQAGEMTLCAFGSLGALRFLSRPEPRVAADYAYHVLAGPGAAAPMMVGGEPALRNEVCDILRRMQPDARVLPLTLSEDLLHLRRLAPEAPFDMLFITQL